MFKRHSTTRSVIAWLLTACLALGPMTLYADPIVCVDDLNGNGDTTEPGESASCIIAGPDQLCPINPTDCTPGVSEVCPIAGNPCSGGVCNTPAACTAIDIFGSPIYFCPTIPGPGGFFGNDAVGCATACSNATQACTAQPGDYTCPLGNQYACVDNAGVQQCSDNACVDLATSPPVDTPLQGQGTMLIDDGDRDADGACLGATVIFNGRAMECLPSGLSTAFQDCCDHEDEIYTDSTGSAVQSTLTNKAVIATFQAATAAYGAYSAAVASGASTGAAASAGASAAGDVFIAAFDPTSLVIAIAIALVLEWLTKACPQESMEAAALMASDYCVELGSYCKRRILGSCVQRGRTQCCFNSKLAKIIHEQGRPQLSTFPNGFGDVEAPDCRGFTPDEFQGLDFSKIDLTEYYDDITRASDAVIQQTIQDGVQRFNDTQGPGG